MTEQEQEWANETQQAAMEAFLETGGLEDYCHSINKRYMRKKRITKMNEASNGQSEQDRLAY